MHKILALTIVAILLILGYVAWLRPTSYTNYPPKNGPVLAFGDSLVVGVGSTPGNDLFSLLSKRINEPIENFGISGDTTAMGLARINTALAREPRVVIILLGGNDYIRRVAKKETFDTLRTIIQTFQKSGSVVLLLGVRGGLLSDNYEEGFAQLAMETGSAYVPNVLEGIIGNPTLLSDQIHPNDTGYALIAERVFPVLHSLIW
jgi:lysophospholipase L1-like esterase